MTNHEFALLVNLYRSMVPEINSKTVGPATRNFKELCSNWNVQIDTERMSLMPNLLMNPLGARALSVTTPSAAPPENSAAVATADDGAAFSDSGGPVAQ